MPQLSLIGQVSAMGSPQQHTIFDTPCMDSQANNNWVWDNNAALRKIKQIARCNVTLRKKSHAAILIRSIRLSMVGLESLFVGT